MATDLGTKATLALAYLDTFLYRRTHVSFLGTQVSIWKYLVNIVQTIEYFFS